MFLGSHGGTSCVKKETVGSCSIFSIWKDNQILLLAVTSVGVILVVYLLTVTMILCIKRKRVNKKPGVVTLDVSNRHTNVHTHHGVEDSAVTFHGNEIVQYEELDGIATRYPGKI